LVRKGAAESAKEEKKCKELAWVYPGLCKKRNFPWPSWSCTSSCGSRIQVENPSTA